MAFFDEFLSLWNKADSEELVQITKHVLEFVDFQQMVESDGKEGFLRLYEERLSKFSHRMSYVSFPNSKVFHAMRFAQYDLTWCGKKVSDEQVLQYSYQNTLFCCLCKRASEVREEDLDVIEGLYNIAKKLDAYYGED